MSKKAKAEHDALIKAKGPQDEIDASMGTGLDSVRLRQQKVVWAHDTF
jgi:hypothetical protein